MLTQLDMSFIKHGVDEDGHSASYLIFKMKMLGTKAEPGNLRRIGMLRSSA